MIYENSIEWRNLNDPVYKVISRSRTTLYCVSVVSADDEKTITTALSKNRLDIN